MAYSNAKCIICGEAEPSNKMYLIRQPTEGASHRRLVCYICKRCLPEDVKNYLRRIFHPQ